MTRSTTPFPAKQRSPPLDWDTVYPYQVLLISHGHQYVSRHLTFGEAMAQYIEWEGRIVVGVSVVLSEAELAEQITSSVTSRFVGVALSGLPVVQTDRRGQWVPDGEVIPFNDCR